MGSGPWDQSTLCNKKVPLRWVIFSDVFLKLCLQPITDLMWGPHKIQLNKIPQVMCLPHPISHITRAGKQSKARDVATMCARVCLCDRLWSRRWECRGELDTGGGRSFWECVKLRATPADRLPLRRGAGVRTGQFTTERGVAAGQAVRFHQDPEMLFWLEPLKLANVPTADSPELC